MALNIGSMLVKAKFEGGNLISGLGTMNSRFKESQLAAKHATTALGRMKGSLLAIGATAALTSGALLGMLMNAIMQSPFLAAALAKLKTQMMLFGNAIARHLAPILEKVVDFVKWLREKFQGLPEPIQAAIVKFIAIGIIILGLLGTIGFLVLALGAIKTALVTLGIGAAITKLGLLASAIAGSTIGGILLGAALGLVAGGLGIIVLDKLGVLTWFEDLGKKIGSLNGFLRDTIILLGTVFGGGLGMAAIDISRGDFELPMFKQGFKQAKEAGGRLWGGTSSQYGYRKESIGFGGELGKSKTDIATQNNTFNVDMSNVSGDMNDPRTINALNTMFGQWLAENQETMNP